MKAATGDIYIYRIYAGICRGYLMPVQGLGEVFPTVENQMEWNMKHEIINGVVYTGVSGLGGSTLNPKLERGRDCVWGVPS